MGSEFVKPDLYEVLVHYDWSNPVPRSGWQPMKCGVHDDTHASAGVNYDKERVNCFACGFRGDVYDVIMYEEGCDFRAARKIGERFLGATDEQIRGGSARLTSRGSPRGSGDSPRRRGWVPIRLRQRPPAG